MSKMKKISLMIIPALLLAGFIIQSCTKLDKRVYSQVSQGNFFKTPEQITAAVELAYTQLQEIPANSTFTLQEMCTDEMIAPTRGNDWYDGGKWQEYWLHDFRPDIDDINICWSDLSSGITECNFVLDILNTLPAKPENFDQTVAEIKVLRALYTFWLMDLYGDIPLVTDYKTDPNKVFSTRRKDVYAFLVNDVTASIPLLPGKSLSNYGRINRYGAYMLLAKLYLNAQVYTGTPQWAKAAVAADSVIQSKQYSLQPNFLDNFAIENQGSVENIFVVPFDNVNIQGNNIEINTLNYNNIYTYNLTGEPYNGYCAPTTFYRSFTDQDARKKMWLVGQQYSSSGQLLVDASTHLKVILSPYVLELSNPADSFKFAGARGIKYAPQPGTFGDTNNDGVIFRLGDAYLMKAEAELRAGTPGDALALVNAIRARAGVPAWTMADLTMPNLLAERGREMAWEGWRRNDLIRFEIADGKPYYTGPRVPEKKQDANNYAFLYPIPSPQLISNPNLTQNPGYGK